MNVNGGTIEVSGDYRLQRRNIDSVGNEQWIYSDGILQMTEEADHVKVGGSFVMQSRQDHGDKLTSGMLEVAGDFSQYKAYENSNNYNFHASGKHKVILNGNCLQIGNQTNAGSIHI